MPRNAVQGTDCNGRTLEFSAEYRWLAEMTLTDVRPVPAVPGAACRSCGRLPGPAARAAEPGARSCSGCL